MLTDEQKTAYNRYRASGIPPERALSIATRDSDNQYNPALKEGVDNILFGEKSLTSAIGGGIKEAVTGGFREIGQDKDKYGRKIAAIKAPISLLAGVGRGVGEVVGGVLETADDLTGEVVSTTAKPLVQDFASSELGQKVISGAEKLNKATYGVSGDILDIANIAGVTGLVKAGTSQAVKQGFKTAAKEATSVTKSTGQGLKDVFGTVKSKTPILKPKTAAQYNDEALKAAAELLQSGSKKSAKGRQAKYNNADIQAMKAIRDSDVPLSSQQGLVDFFDDTITTATKERDALLRPHLTATVDDTYMSPLKAQIKELRVAGDLKEASAYAKLLAKEKELFAKIGKEAQGGKNTVAQLDARIKEINKKVQKLFNDVGGKENLLPDQKIEVQAYELLRQGLKKQLDEIGGDTYKEAGSRVSGLIDARTFSRIQRDRAKNALTDIPWEAMSAKERALFIKEYFPTIKDIGISKLVKLDTKSDVLDGLVESKVRLIRDFGAKGAVESPPKGSLKK